MTRIEDGVHGDGDWQRRKRRQMMHTVPAEWIGLAGLQGFKPATSAFRCDVLHELMAIADIERPKRKDGYTLDANGFRRERMMRVLTGIRAGDALPPIEVEISDPGQRPYR